MLLGRPKPPGPQDGSTNPARQSIAGSNISRIPASSDSWAGDYLKDLRMNRPARPTGARPLPSKNESKPSRTSVHMFERAASAFGMYETPVDEKQAIPERAASALGHRQAHSTTGPRGLTGLPVARPPANNLRNISNGSQKTAATSKTVQNITSTISKADNSRPYQIPYYERGQRWMEKQEMSSLRRALEETDLVEEQKLYQSAQDEAAKLVWQHRNPGAPYPNPDKVNLREHLKQGSHARRLSNTPYENLYVCKGGSDGSRSASDGSNGTQRSTSDGSQASAGSRSGRFSVLSFSVRSSRMFGSKKSRIPSLTSKAVPIVNLDDRIYEEPKDVVQTIQNVEVPMPLRIRARNTSYGTKSLKEKISVIEEKNENPTPFKSIVEIYKNPPSQSRDPRYLTNKSIPEIPEKGSTAAERSSTRDGKEIRANDIRSATSMTIKSRSPKLPMPTVVSDRPGRPIVSFKKDYKPRQKELQHEILPRSSSLKWKADKSASPAIPTIVVPEGPSIQVNDTPVVRLITLQDTPSIQVNNKPALPSFSITSDASPPRPQSVPAILIGPDSTEIPGVKISASNPISTPSSGSASRPLPQPAKPNQPFQRPLPLRGNQSGTKSSIHWSPTKPREIAQCTACALPIAGKIVSASGKRFHPHCFTCFCCGELLECVAFYPEPEKFRAQRLARIQNRLFDAPIPQDQAQFTEADDGDDGLRFYCHLDFHERFSPRCKSCKTPIEGQVIVACGAQWHVGHFFCAECGDPFEAETPFVEKNGFAWCVNCHTKRFSGKCGGCRKPITDLVVTALGKEWHGECFRCKECGGDFEDGRFFTRGEDEVPVCVKCEERRLKA